MAAENTGLPADTGVPEADRIEVERRGGVAVIALNRPDVHNAMDDALRGELVKVIESYEPIT